MFLGQQQIRRSLPEAEMLPWSMEATEFKLNATPVTLLISERLIPRCRTKKPFTASAGAALISHNT